MPHVVIIGAGLGGLSAAIHARLKGWSVTVLEQHDAPGGKAAQIVQEGYRLDPGPSIVILTEIYERVFERAGRKMEDYLRFRRLDPFTRVFFEGQGGPLDLPADEVACMDLLESFAPEDAQEFRKLMARLDRASGYVDDSIFAKPIHQPWEMMNLPMARFAQQVPVRTPFRTEVDRMFKSPILRAFFYGFPSYGGQSYRTPSPGSFLIPFYMIRRGVWWPEGGIGAIPRAFAKLAEELGVKFEYGVRAQGLKIEKGRVVAVNTSQGEIAADAVISNQDRLTTREWREPPTGWKPSYSYFTVHMGVRRKMPELKHHTLLIPKAFEPGFEELYDRRVFPQEPIVYLNETTAVEPDSAPEGCTNLFAVVTVPAMEDHLDWERDEDAYRIRVQQELAQHGIDIKEPDVAFYRVQTPAYFARMHGNYKGSLYGPDEKHRLWGFMPLRCRDEQVSNLFYAGGSVQPGAGMPMVTLSGMFAANLL